MMRRAVLPRRTYVSYAPLVRAGAGVASGAARRPRLLGAASLPLCMPPAMPFRWCASATTAVPPLATDLQADIPPKEAEIKKTENEANIRKLEARIRILREELEGRKQLHAFAS